MEAEAGPVPRNDLAADSAAALEEYWPISESSLSSRIHWEPDDNMDSSNIGHPSPNGVLPRLSVG